MAEDATFEYPVGDRVIVFKKLSPGRFDVLRRYMAKRHDIARTTTDEDVAMRAGHEASDAFWQVLESLFVDPADVEWLQREILAGRVDDAKLWPIMYGFMITDAPEDDADPKSAKRPAKKAAAKKTANPRRANR